MQGPRGRNKGAKGAKASLQYLVCVCPRLQKPNHSKFTRPEEKKNKKPDGGNPAAGPGPAAETQHRPLQARRCSFMSPLPSMNLRIFPNISPAPCPPSGCNLSPASLPFCLPGFYYSSPRPLLSTRAATEPKKKKKKKKKKLFPPNFGALPLSHPRLVHRKHSDVRITSLR